MGFDFKEDEPRSIEQVEAALKFVTHELVQNPTGKCEDGSPSIFHYLTIRDVLKVYLNVSRRSGGQNK